MTRIKIIYNPNSGRQILQKNIPTLIKILNENSFKKIDAVATMGISHAKELAIKACIEKYDTIIAIGGDGTINEVVNGIMQINKPVNLAIYPAGTVNDFGNYLKIPKNIDDFARIIIKNNTMKVDVAKTKDRYFVNVAAAGLLTDVAHKVSNDAKTVLGKFAYYIEGIREFPKQVFNPIYLTIDTNGRKEEKEVLFFLLTNSPSVGGFKNMAPEAKIDDGFFDLLVVEKSEFKDFAHMFIKTLTGNHIGHPNLHYIQTNRLSIDCKQKVELDLDGELAGVLPTTFEVIPRALNIIVPYASFKK